MFVSCVTISLFIYDFSTSNMTMNHSITISFILVCLLVSTQGRSQQLLQNDTVRTQSQPLQTQSVSVWTHVDVGNKAELHDVQFINRDTGWVGGEEGLFATVDGGVHWKQVFNGGHCQRVRFLDVLHGWLVTAAGANSNDLFHTLDGGKTWEQQITDVIPADMLPLDVSNGVACGGQVMYRSTNSGKDWVRQVVDANGSKALSASGPTSIYCVGRALVWHNQFNKPVRSEINFSSDSGKTWTRLEADTLQHDLYCVKALSPLHVVVGGAEILALTRDGGITWKVPHVVGGFQWEIDNLYFSDSLHGWLSGGTGLAAGLGLLAKTSDGGDTWIVEAFDSVNIQTSGGITFSDSSNGWLIAHQGLFHLSAPSSVSALVLSRDPTVTSYPEPFRTASMIEYTLPTASKVSLDVFNISGAVMASPLRSVSQVAGKHSVLFDGSMLPAGVYTYTLQAGQSRVSGKFTHVK
jgi:photosystem II stability/assembly factor-like uncharacterized protein